MMRLPRTQTSLAAVLLLSAAPFALAVPPPASSPGTQGSPAQSSPSTQGVTPPETSPGTTNPGTMNPRATSPQTGSSTSTASTGWSRSHVQMRSAERVPTADLHAAKNAKVSLTDAINTAQQQNHGNVVSARFELRQGKPEYLIRTFDSQNQSEWLGHIDARTGNVIGQGQTIPLSRLPKEDQQELTASTTSGASLGQAVQTVEQQRGGKALSAGLSSRNGQVSYRTELLKSNGRTQMAMVNPSSGQVSSYR